MSVVECRTQKELDAAIKKSVAFIDLVGGGDFTVRACDSSTVSACGSSTVTATKFVPVGGRVVSERYERVRRWFGDKRARWLCARCGRTVKDRYQHSHSACRRVS